MVPGQRPTASGPRRARAIPRHANAQSAQPHEPGEPLDAPAQHHHLAQPAHTSPHAHQRAPRSAQARRPFGSAPMPAARRARMFPLPHAQQQLLEVRQPPSPSRQQSWHLYFGCPAPEFAGASRTGSPVTCNARGERGAARSSRRRAPLVALVAHLGTGSLVSGARPASTTPRVFAPGDCWATARRRDLGEVVAPRATALMTLPSLRDRQVWQGKEPESGWVGGIRPT
jgi:hypothetical protein